MPERETRSERRRRLALWAAIVAAVGLLMFAYRYLAEVTSGAHPPWTKELISELTAAFGAGLLYLGVWALVERRPLDEGRWRRHALLYPPALLLFSALHTSSNWLLRSLLFPLAGLGPYDYGRMPLRYFMELPMDVIVFTLLVGALHVGRRMRRARQRELDAVRTEAFLSEARLQNLRLQLQPHFLFNALNTISSTMYRDVEGADRMIERLADLLRASLRTERGDVVTLAEELDALEAYLDIQRARFGERMSIARRIDESALEARLPAFVLQPLVENSVRHGVEARGHGSIVIRAHRDGERLEVAIEDDGPGAPEGADPFSDGLGLRITAERLRLHYGEDQELEAANRPQGGFLVTLRLPAEPVR